MPSAFPPPPSITIETITARRFALTHHKLWPPRQLKGKAGVLEYIRHVGSIQFDPINIVGRNPDLVLQSRVKDYRPAMLDELLYEDRQLLDGWDKMASIYAVNDWPYFARRRKLMEEYLQVEREIVAQVAPDILENIRQQGPLCSLDFKGYEKADWSWGPTKASRAGLEGLFNIGTLGVHHRVNNRRYFDLTERLLPAELLTASDPNQDDEAYQDWHVLRRVGALGLAHPHSGEHWHGIVDVKSRERQQIITRLVETGQVHAVKVEELPQHTFFIRDRDLPTLKQVQENFPPIKEATILAPLDNFLWYRKMINWLFDFEYIWEVYKPKAQRQYGYYTLPVIYDDGFIARFDPAFDKKSHLLTIQNWWWEEGIEPSDEIETALVRCFQDFVSYLGAQEVVLGEGAAKDKSLNWVDLI